MAEFQGMATIKNLFLAPVAKAKAETESSSNGSSASAVSNVSRHDHHNIEIKTVSELSNAPSVVETDLYLFVPKSFEITSIGKNELIKDFRSRIRLALPVHGEQSAVALDSALKNLRQCLTHIEAAEQTGEPVADLSHALCEEAFESTKDLCAVVSEALKHGAADHSRQFFLSQSLMTVPSACAAGLDNLVTNVQGMHDLISKVRMSVESSCPATQSILSYFDEYVSHLYVQYLNTIRTDMEKIGAPKLALQSEDYKMARMRVENLLDKLQAEEGQYRVKFGSRSGAAETELDLEQRVLRLSHLKKFFQSKTFVAITRHQSAAKISESTATIGTAFAGLTAAMIERYSHSAGNVAFGSFAFLCLGVIIYVLRDRMKDWAKAQFHARALKFLPDFEQHLMAKDAKIGSVKEWFQLLKKSGVPEQISDLRKRVCSTEMEKRLPEDVFNCHKIQTVNAHDLSGKSNTQSRTLHENTRLNLERYLKHMDDPFKEITDLDPNGRLQQSRSHRVYYFYLFVRTMSRAAKSGWFSKLAKQSPDAGHEQMLAYRIVLDKTGVVRIEDLA